MSRFARTILLAMLTLVLLAGALPSASAANISFSDVKGHWSEPFVYAGVDAGYINGHTDGSFRPDDTVTRGQFSKMINHALEISNSTTISFNDVSHNAWYFPEVQKALASGYISGYNDNTFRADVGITRQEAAVMVARVIAPPEVEYSIAALADSDDVASWAAPYVKTVFSKKYMVGDTANNFLPDEPLTRGAAAKILTLVLENEKIISNSPTATASGTNYNNTIFTNNLNIGSSVGDGSVSLGNCRVLGTLNAAGGGSSSGVVLRDSAINNLNMNKDSGNLNLVAVGNTTVNKTVVSKPGHLEESSVTGSGFVQVQLSGSSLDDGTVTLTGDFPDVGVYASCVVKGGNSRINMMRVHNRCNLVVQSGNIDELEIHENAKDATVLMNSGVKCSLANVYAPIRFTGDCKISHAVEHCKDIYYSISPGKITEYDDGSYKPVSGADTLTPTISPTSGSTGIALDRTIRLTFSESIYRANGNAMTEGYLESSVIELRKTNATGALVDFEAELSSSSRVVTITPSSNLSPGTKYYVNVIKDSITNSNGDSNAKSSFSFTTQTLHTLAPSITPANNATKVSRTASIVLTFDEPILQPNGNAMTISYFKGVFELREGSYDGRNNIICDVTLNSNKKVTLKPQVELEPDTTYYLVLKEDTLSSDRVGSNSQFSSCFSTGTTVRGLISVSPDDKAQSVDIHVSPELSFTRALRAYGGGTLTDKLVQNGAIELRKGTKTGSTIDFYASVNSDRKRITLSPDELATNTTYYIIIPDGKLEYSDGEAIPRTEYSFKTGDNTAKITALSVVTAQTTASSVQLSMTTSLNGKMTLTATPTTKGSTAPEVVVRDISVSAGSNKLQTITGLEPKTAYSIKGVFSPSNGNKAVEKSVSVTTKDPTLTLTVGTPDREEMTVDVTATVDAFGIFSLSYKEKAATGDPTMVLEDVSPPASYKFEETLSNLEGGKTYVVTATYRVGTLPSIKTAEFTMPTASTEARLQEVGVQMVDGTRYLAWANLEPDGVYRREINENTGGGATKIRIVAKPMDSAATVRIKGPGDSSFETLSGSTFQSKEYTVEPDTAYEFTVEVIPESGESHRVTHTLQVIFTE